MVIPESLESHRQAFLEALRVRNYSPATLESWGRSLHMFFKFLARRSVEEIREVTRKHIQDFQGWLLKARITSGGVIQRGYKPWSAINIINAVRRLFEHLEKMDVILMNPCDGLLLPKHVRSLPRNILTEEEVKIFLRAPNTQKRAHLRNRAMLELFYSTGIRLNEMIKLTLDDVDTTHGFVRINAGKGRKDRVVPMGNRACSWLRAYLFKVRGQWSNVCREERALWLSAQGKHGPLCKGAIAEFFKDYRREAGINKMISPHVLRHTCATHLVARGANVVHVQKLLGHSSLQTTQIYARVAIPEMSKTYHRAHPRAASSRRRRKTRRRK